MYDNRSWRMRTASTMMANNEERAAAAARPNCPIRPPLRPVWQPTPNHQASQDRQDETEGKFCGHFCSIGAPFSAASPGPRALQQIRAFPLSGPCRVLLEEPWHAAGAAGGLHFGFSLRLLWVFARGALKGPCKSFTHSPHSSCRLLSHCLAGLDVGAVMPSPILRAQSVWLSWVVVDGDGHNG